MFNLTLYPLPVVQNLRAVYDKVGENKVSWGLSRAWKMITNIFFINRWIRKVLLQWKMLLVSLPTFSVENGLLITFVFLNRIISHFPC